MEDHACKITNVRSLMTELFFAAEDGELTAHNLEQLDYISIEARQVIDAQETSDFLRASGEEVVS